MNEVYVLKLITGEEVIGIVEDEKINGDPDFINLSNPHTIINDYVNIHHLRLEGMGIFFKPYMNYSESLLFTFPRRSIILYTRPSKEFSEYYLYFLSNNLIKH